MTYVPRPVAADVDVPPELMGLVEQLAQNVHDEWARQRIAAGWRYGKTRDDDQRTHPDLVPYNELPHSEQDYDRNTALATIRTILALGYRIAPPGAAAESPDAAPDEGASARD